MRSKAEVLAFVHTVLAQVAMPLRDPGDEVRVWYRTNGAVSLRMAAGAAFHPDGEWIELGLPHGPKPRLMMALLNAQALQSRSPDLDVESTLAGFTRRLGLDDGGRTTANVREQLVRLASADIRLGIRLTAHTSTVERVSMFEEVEVWAPRRPDERRVMWPTHIRLAPAYFEDLMSHAVPLHEVALRRLSGSAVGLDAYAWLAQRLHRVPVGRPVLVSWEALHHQFGSGFSRVRDFRRDFTGVLRAVLRAYPAARVEDSAEGLLLIHSRPPVSRRGVALALPSPAPEMALEPAPMEGSPGCE